MKIYISGGFLRQQDELVIKRRASRLVSFYYKKDMERYLELLRGTRTHNIKTDLMIDSGAFSAWNKGININLAQYRDFCSSIIKNHEDIVDIYVVNLDVIPGAKNRSPTAKERISAAQTGIANLQYMLQVIPAEKMIHVFHMYEDFKVINEIRSMVPYIGISPANDVSLKVKTKWMREVFDYLEPGIKTHGFAVTGIKQLREFPWYSVDSASPAISAAMGNIFTPWGAISVSEINRKNILRKQHIVEKIIEYIEEINIVSFDEIKSNGIARRIFNVNYMLNLEDQFNDSNKHSHEVKYIKSQTSLLDLL